jgi:hypothetical protein
MNIPNNAPTAIFNLPIINKTNGDIVATIIKNQKSPKKDSHLKCLTMSANNI